jgi:predicted nucleic acid-binding protein
VARVVVLDSGVLALLAHPRPKPDAVACHRWAADLGAAGLEIVIPEIADYEVRRELVRSGARAGLRRLDQLGRTLVYSQLTTRAMRRAAQLWAQARNRGLATADRHALDGDVILAAQAELLVADPADLVVATTNVAHIARFVPAAAWRDIAP